MTEDGSTILKSGTDVAIILPDKSFPGRIAKVLKNGLEITAVEWVGAGEGYELELTDGTVISTRVVVPGDHTCIHCDQRLRQESPGVFNCTCEDWKS